MKTVSWNPRVIALCCSLLFVFSLFAFISPNADAAPGHVIRRTKEETKKKNAEKGEEKKEDKKEDKEYKDNSYSDNSSSQSKTKYYHDDDYYYRRDNRHKTHYSYYSPSYSRVVDINFNEASARLNEGFFYDEEADVEYLPGEWFDIVLGFDCYAIVPGEDVKIRYVVYDINEDKRINEKIFRPILSGTNNKNIFRAIPKSLLDESGKLYVEITLTIEGNDAFGGFWLETVPRGNEGPLRIGDVVIGDAIDGGEANPRTNLIEGQDYKLFMEYQVDYYLGESALVEWHIYDPEGRDIAAGTDYIQPKAGYGYYIARFAVAGLTFSGTQACLLDVKIIASPYLGRRILEINVSGNDTGQHSDIVPTAMNGSKPLTAPSYGVEFRFADVIALGEANVTDTLNPSQEIYAMVEYEISGISNGTKEELDYLLTPPNGSCLSGTMPGTVNNGNQHRYIKLPIKRDAEPGEYKLDVDVWLNGFRSGSEQMTFTLEPPPFDIKVEAYGADENYFQFDGFNLFLPYEWDITEHDAGLTMDAGNGITGALAFNTFFWDDAETLELQDAVDTLEEGMKGVVLTRKSDIASGRDVLSTLFLDMEKGTAVNADLYAYFIHNRTKRNFDFTIINLNADPDNITELYDALDIMLEGLFFTDAQT